MRFVFLGTGTSAGVPAIGCVCAVCTSEDTRDRRLRTAAALRFTDVKGQERVILLDAGPDLRQQALRAGLPISERPAFWPTNPAPASYAIISAQAAVAKGAAGDLAGFVQGLSRAVWAEDRDIADADVLGGIMAAAGFDPAIADKGMFMAAETYTANLEEAVQRGVFGVPFYIVGEERFWGQDRLDDLDLHLAGKL